MRKSLKIIGLVVASITVLVVGYFALLMYPGALFANAERHGNITIYSQDPLNAEVINLLSDIDSALRTSAIHDPSLEHDILFGHDNFLFRSIQNLKWRIVTAATGIEPALTYNESAPPHFSHIITFRIPDVANNGLIHPDNKQSINMTRLLTHEIVHTYLRSQLGPGVTRYPMWKLEGYSDYIAASTNILAAPTYDFWNSVGTILDHDLSWMQDREGNYTPMRRGCAQRSSIRNEDGQLWPTCYYISRVLMEYLFNIKRLDFETVMSRGVSDTGTLNELASAYASRSAE